MALIPKFPLHKRISFLPQSKYVQVGRLPEEDAIIRSSYVTVQSPIWERLAEARLRVTEAKSKFSNMHAGDVKKQWGKWDEQTIDSYRLQFRVIDINEDGLIDFKELCLALDEIGDTSSYEERKKYFKEVDTDQSDGVDFEEFLELIERVQCTPSGEGLGKIEFATNSGVQDAIRIGQLSLMKQIQYGLF